MDMRIFGVLCSLLVISGCVTTPVQDRPLQRAQANSAKALAQINKVTVKDVHCERLQACPSDLAQYTKRVKQLVQSQSDFELASSGADAVIDVQITSFKDASAQNRSSGSFRGGKVAFVLTVTPAGFKSPIWTDTTSKEDRPLSDDLFRMREASPLRWENSFDLFSNGVSESLDRLARARRQSFVAR